MLRLQFLLCAVALVAFSVPPAWAQTEAVLTPAGEYSRIPTRSESQADEPTTADASSTNSPRPKVERIPLVTRPPAYGSGYDNVVSGSFGPTTLPDTGGDHSLQPSGPDQSGDQSELIEIGPSEDISTVLGEGGYGHYRGLKKLDLLDYLPAPQEQKKQNCVAWAVGYANYSCQICQQRKKQNPADPYDLFSPSYIYNRLSPDKDEGLYIGQAVDLLKRYGCATLSTMPLGSDQPGPSANTEAKLYRAVDHQRATGVEDIRSYIQEGYPVILVVRLDKELSDGNFEGAYQWDKSKMGSTLGMHAVCAVGYDDTEKTILVMNSRGESWHDGGFFKVHYDTLKTIPTNRGTQRRNGRPVRDEDLPFWCLEAHVVIVKERTPSVALRFDRFKVRFQIKNDMVFNGKLRVTFDASKNEEWRIQDIATNQDTVFLLRDDQVVVKLNNKTEFVFEDDVYPQWLHLTHGIPSGSKINMIAAATDTPLFAVTSQGVLLRRDSQASIWKQEAPRGVSELRFVDVRDVSEDQVAATTASGRIFMFNAESGWQDSVMGDS